MPTSRSGRSLGWIAQKPEGDAFAFPQGKGVALDVYNARLLKKADFVDPALGKTPIPYYAVLDQARYDALVVPTLTDTAGIAPRDQKERQALHTEATTATTLNLWMPDVAKARRDQQEAQRKGTLAAYTQPGGGGGLVARLPPPPERVPALNPSAPRAITDTPDTPDTPDPAPGMAVDRESKRPRRGAPPPSLSMCNSDTRTREQRERSVVRSKSRGAPSSVRRSTRPRKPNRQLEE